MDGGFATGAIFPATGLQSGKTFERSIGATATGATAIRDTGLPADIGQTLAAANAELEQNLPADTQYRTRLRIDGDTQRIVAEIVDRTSGDVVDSFPPDLVLGMIARNREALGPLVEMTA